MQANVQTSNIDSENLPPPGKYLTFWLDDELFGIPVLKVREIMRICPITPVPRVPLYIKGVINLRGKILPVIDLRARLQMSAFNNHDRVCIIVVQYTNNIGEMNLIGMIVDAVDEVAFFGSSQMSITPDFGNTLDTRFIVGMAESKGGVKTILDIDKLLSSDDELQIKSKIQ
jgi:purine-binding chemotaxis protein CheW